MLNKLSAGKKLFLITLLFFAGVTNLMAQDDEIVYLEYAPGHDPLRSILVNWITDSDDADPELEYREEGESDWTEVSGSDNRIPISGPNSGKRRNSVLINNLSPDRSYEIRVEGKVERFRTPPSDGNDLRFIIGGDMYDGNSEDIVRFTELSKKAVDRNPHFAVVGGDIVNANADPDVAPQRWQIFMRKWYEQMRTSENELIPFIAIIGNNDVPNDFGDEPQDASYFHSYFSYPGFQGYGALDFGDFLRIITLNTSHTVPIEGTQTEWLEDRISEVNGSIDNVLPIYHVAAFPSVENFNNEYSTKVRENWKPIFENYGVEYVFEHDNHAYKKVNSNNGVTYLGDGGWGIESRLPKRLISIIKLDEYAKVNHLQFLELNDSGVDVEQIFYLEPPTLKDPSNITENGFRAEWVSMEGVDNYRITLSRDDEFDDIVSGLDNVFVSGGDSEGFTFSGLETNETYYYRVKAEISSNVSNTISGEFEEESIRISTVDPDESTVVTEADEVTADGNDKTRIIVRLKDEDGFKIPGVRVDIDASLAGANIDQIREVTNSDGEAIFEVTSTIPGTITFTAEAERPSGIMEISEKIEIDFIPEAPISLNATEVDNNGFIANWEIVEGADSYLLDVSADESFESFVPGYKGLDVGFTTDFEISDVDPGSIYYYRVRAEKDGLRSKNSQTVDVTTYPNSPISNSSGNVGATIININWNDAEGAQEYLLDVAKDQEFTDYVSDFERLNIGNQTSYEVSNLVPGTTYYFRVRSKAFTRLSEPSATVDVETAEIGVAQSELTSSQLRVLANGEQENTITILLRDSDNKNIEGEKITLVSNISDTEIRSIQTITDEDGVAIHAVSSNKPGEATYTAYVAGTYKVGELSIEFLPVEGSLKLGDNYPNPFNNQATIPVTVPNQMQVKITISNILGESVKTVIDQSLESGYYEIPVNLQDVASGTYFYRLWADDQINTKKMLLVK
ncbi:Ig-like domain-containing protein [Rhodohalobacter sulfatireducens]|uniref:Ig-like domain-containing protein n=1 Tax=Rhodohalobacter sulfatireducens TaxID=2911366 RepID=A0ABS9KIQ9_9BACT|nr:fibronectin type III domain-containing protein [Rhodohalobacter sulfatireducens]MCG2590677.1 Ig-like domain-containing protein [Rhodohalobacter sulfatireducens]